MKCPACSNSHKHKSGMQCSCGYRFVFDPKRHGMADGRLKAMLARVSGNGAYVFTPNQLYAEQIRRMPKRAGAALVFGAIGLALCVGATIVFELGEYMIFVGFPFLAIAVFGLIAKTRKPVPRTEWDALIAQVRDAGRLAHIDQMIVRPELADAPQAPGEDDVFDYGVERILVVDQDLMVDLLVKNGFHASERCLVVAESGYPEYIRRHARRFLSESSDLPIFVLHEEARQRPTAMARAARALDLTEAELASHPVTDLGVSEEDVKRMGLLKQYHQHLPDTPVPFDALPFATLQSGLGACLAGGLTMAMLAQQSQASSAYYGSDFG